ncbi:hypothetical protein [Singulisphaera sp. PoT]|uniref:hypothetical protein n=1 Tax=Singulisphaera sp. PoT TaxID=3411797 RepID=UPI003BF48E3C
MTQHRDDHHDARPASPRTPVAHGDPDGEGGSEPVLFNDQYGTPWARVPHGDRLENLQLRGRAFRNWLIRGMLDAGERPTRGRIAERLDEFEAYADQDRRALHNRSAWHEEGRSPCIDLADERWRTVVVGESGWEVAADPGVLFRRFAHQIPLPDPDPSGDLRDLLPFLPPLRCEADRILVLTYLVAALVPMPRPILMPVGPQGSAKSTLCSLVRRLVDPSRAELLGRDARADLVQTFYRHAVPVFDNASDFTPVEADLCCQAVTGRAIDRRRLYTDGEEYLLSFFRAIVVNGIRPPTNRPDLLDRSLIIELERLTHDRRRYPGRLEAEFREASPRLFGGLLNAPSRTLSLLPSVPEDGLSRMADFHRFGRAAALAPGFTVEAFDAAMREAESRRRRNATDSPPVAALLPFARKQGRWAGDPTTLLERLADTARAHQVRRTPESWPDTPIGLGRQLTRLAVILAEHGVALARPRKARERLVSLEYDPAADLSLEG